jgi:hypothetical protein
MDARLSYAGNEVAMKFAKFINSAGGVRVGDVAGRLSAAR